MGNLYLQINRLLLLVLCLFVVTSAAGQITGGRDFFLQLDEYHGQIQWEQSTDRQTWVAVPNGSVGRLKLTPAQTTLYRAKITAPGCSPVYSDVKAAFFDTGRIVAAKLIKGKVVLPEGAAGGLNGYTIMSEVESSRLNSDGSFEILVADSTDQDVLLLLNGREEVTMLGHYIGPQEEYVINSESTALALLVMYPFLKPVSISEKKALVESYKAEVEFKQLSKQVEALAKEGAALFSSSNDGIRATVNLLIDKGYNKDRFRLQSVNDIIDSPLSIISDGSSVKITNVTPFSYVGSIYRKSDDSIIKAFFIVPGGLLRSSSFVQRMRPPDYALEEEDLQHERIFDLKSLGKEVGEYEIRLRSGRAFDNTDEDNLARGENMYEMLMYILDNLSLGVVDDKHSEAAKQLAACFGSLADDMANKTKILLTANSDTDILKEVVIPTLSKETEAVGKCGISGPFLFTSKVLKYLDVFNKREEHINAWSFPLTWSLANKKVDACQYLGQNLATKEYKTTSCFVFDQVTKLDERYLPGETVPITVRAIENYKYYPYSINAVKELDFTWLTLTGAFAPDRKVNPAGKTDLRGEATVEWILSCREEKNTVTVSLPGIDFSVYKDILITSTHVPPLKVDAKGGDSQMGEKGKRLPVPISFAVKNLDDKSIFPYVDIDNFNIKWEVFKGGKWEEIKGEGVIEDDYNNPNAQKFLRKYWTLDTVDGEQKIRAILEDKCGMKWNIEENPVIFTANSECKISRIEIWDEEDEDFGDIISYDYEYNDKGKIIKETEFDHYDQTKEPNFITTFIHNTQNQLSRVNFEESGEGMYAYDTHEYDNNGNLIKTLDHDLDSESNYLNRNIDQTTYKYDSSKRLIEENWYRETHYSATDVRSQGSKTTYEYIGSTGNISRIRDYDEEGKLRQVVTFESYSDKINPYYLIGYYSRDHGGHYSRNAPGKVTSINIIDGKEETRVTTYSYKYNPKGDIVEMSGGGETHVFTYSNCK
ncbi:hypothetical protein [Pontibacter harenae]|uniref:hypothetical protein n=1 Tax=Pontibacter harenae TaxID=2894083 RepID=UPI001E350BD3|nr:hypothetical protein [Pontibacter harenae]MCC9168984.1 hypothetical protein [Pontibacter harenae]